ncbi:MAG: LD-carboxypeptidase [Flavobacteriales bacterium]|nr:MAG: LD-carboxypeptidase [Flavobacteriales bacterium]
MEKPAYLKKGDKVAIVATARKISKEEIRLAVKVLKSWGLVIVLGENLFKEDNQFSGATEQRTFDLQKALDDETVKAIFCVRGGYGTVKIIDELDFSKFIETPKWIVGYSDVTVLHNHINQNFSIQTLHATMPINFAENSKESLESLRNALFGEKLSYDFDSHKLNQKGNTEGILVGGNLSIIFSLTGTNSQLNTACKILFIEDLDEYLYHIDRMMMNLKRAGMLENLSGLIVGGMSNMNDNSIPYGKTAIEIIKDAVKDYDYPVCFGFEAGHLDNNQTLIMGEKIELIVEEKCSLRFNS